MTAARYQRWDSTSSVNLTSEQLRSQPLFTRSHSEIEFYQRLLPRSWKGRRWKAPPFKQSKPLLGSAWWAFSLVCCGCARLLCLCTVPQRCYLGLCVLNKGNVANMCHSFRLKSSKWPVKSPWRNKLLRFGWGDLANFSTRRPAHSALLLKPQIVLQVGKWTSFPALEDLCPSSSTHFSWHFAASLFVDPWVT